MVRIGNKEIPGGKNILTSLTYIKGIGRSLSKKVVESSNIDWKVKVKDLTDDQISRISKEVSQFPIEGELNRIVSENIKSQIFNRSYKGQRRVLGLPVRGQRTRHNARTNKGPRKTVAGKKSSTLKK